MSTHQYIDILRYWNASIRHEESLTTRPKASRILGPKTFNWQRPVGNHSYFKAPRSGAFEDLLMGNAASVQLDVGPEHRSFLARQVRQVYYRQDHAWQTDESMKASVVAGFPVLYFPRSDELATLVRLRVGLEWFDETGRSMMVPTRKERERKAFPEQPRTYVLKRLIDDEDGILPLSIDGRVLTQDLGLPEEVVQDFMNGLSAQESMNACQLVWTLIQLIKEGDWAQGFEMPTELEPGALARELLDVVRLRLAGEGRTTLAYDVGLVYDGAQTFTTHHLRRDLSMIISGRSRKSLVQDGPLRAYLSGQTSLPSLAALNGQSDPLPLSLSQRLVAEQFLGSVFTAAQGPPGTGKTRLISDISAHVLIQRMHAVASSDELGGPCLLVTSTNNRAVDQVMDALQQGLPWGLRAGSQQVTETATVATIDVLLNWLEEQTEHDLDWEQEKQRFIEVYAAADSESSVHNAYRRYLTESLAIAHERFDIEHLQPPELYGQETKLLEVGLLKLDDVLDRMTLLMQRFKAILSLLDPVSQASFESAVSAWKKLKRGAWQHGLDVFESCGLSLSKDPISKPDKDADLSSICQSWREGLESIIDDLSDMYLVVENVRVYRKKAQVSSRVSLRAEEHAARQVEPVDATAMNHAQFTLFGAAKRLRLAWMYQNRVEVMDLLTRLRETAIEFRSLRRFFQQSRRDTEMLQTIFPVIGSTLLSLANTIGNESDLISHVVIDEGGQCHSAYAVSALMRARHALVIGDVHQLEPVYTLSAEDDKRVQKAARVDLSVDTKSIFRVFEGASSSAQVLADRVLREPMRLTDHYRSTEGVIGLCDELCGYNLNVHTQPSSLSDFCPTLQGPLLFTPVDGQQMRTRGSWYNDAEVAQVVEWLFHLFEHGITANRVAVLTPYVGQLDALRGVLHRRGISTVDQPGLSLKTDERLPIGTVHRFQGGERDIILYSSVITTTRSLQFQNQRVNLLNVAVSRARKHFITVGQYDVIAQGRFTQHLTARSTIVPRRHLAL